MNSKLAALLLAAMALIGCTEKADKPIVEHAPAAKEPARPLVIGEQPETTEPSQFTKYIQTQAQQSKDVLKEVILPLADKVLDPKRVSAPASLTARSVRDELVTFNQLILRTTEKDRARPEFAKLLERYRIALTTECGSFSDSCTGMNYLKISGNSAQVVKLISQYDEKHRYTMLLFSIKMLKNTWDLELIRLLYMDPAKTLTEAETKYREGLLSMMETALHTAKARSPDPKADREFLESIQAWKLADGEARHFEPSTQTALYEMIARAGMLYDAQGALHPDLQAIIKRAELDNDGVFAQQNRLIEDKLLSVEMIGVKQLAGYDLLTFLIDQVFSGKMDSHSAAILFGSSKHTAMELCEAVKNYVRLSFLLALNNSTAMAIQIFNAEVQGQDLVFHFIKESSQIRNVWATFTTNAQKLQRFAIQSVSFRSSSEKVAGELNKYFDSTQKSINMASTYPHTLILFHMLSLKKFEMRIPGSGRVIDTGTLMTMLFNQKLDPLLEYSENKEAFNQFQLVYAFDMALRTSLFRFVKIDADFFVADILRRLTGDSLEIIDMVLNATQMRFSQTPSFEQFKRACSEIKGKRSNRYLYFAELKDSPIYGNLLDVVKTSVENAGSQSKTDKGGLPIMQMGIMYIDNRYSDLVDRARLDLGNTLRIGRALQAALLINLRQQGLSAQEIEKKTEQTRKALGDIEKRRKDVLEVSKRLYDEVGSCYVKLFQRDAEAQIQALKMEKAYLRQLHRDIKRLQTPGLSDKDKTAIEERHQFHGLPSGFKGLNRINADGVTYTQVDFLIRLAGYLKKGLTTDEGTLPPLAPDLDLNLGQNLDIDVPEIAKSEKFFLAYTESEDEFVKSAIRAILMGPQSKGSSKYVFWLSNSAFLTHWLTYISSLATLHRLDHELTGTTKNFPGETVLEMQEDILATLKLSKEQKELQDTLMLVAAADALSLHNKVVKADLFDRRITETGGLYDFPIKLMQREQLGYYYFGVEVASYGAAAQEAGAIQAAVARPGMFTAGEQYYSSRSSFTRGSSLIPYNKELDGIMDKEIIGFVRGDLRAIQDFTDLTKSHVKKVAALPPEQRPRVDVNASLSVTDLLTDSIISSFDVNLYNFSQKTSNCYTSDTKCPAFEQ